MPLASHLTPDGERFVHCCHLRHGVFGIFHQELRIFFIERGGATELDAVHTTAAAACAVANRFSSVMARHKVRSLAVPGDLECAGC